MLEFKRPTDEELQLMHEAYVQTLEPDAPEKKFVDMSIQEQVEALEDYKSQKHFSVYDENNLIGFVGLFPDGENFDVDIFFLVLPAYRQKGYLVRMLERLKHEAREHYSHYMYLRALTRQGNLAAIKGLEKADFVREPQLLETLDPQLSYCEYLFRINK